MSKKCLNDFEMSKAESLIVEFFNNADSVQVEEEAWYYSEASVNSELLDVYAQLAKANERVSELEQENLTLLNTIAQYPDCFPEKDKQAINKFAIENQIKGIENAISYAPSKENYALPLVDTTDLYDYCEQLRKEQTND